MCLRDWESWSVASEARIHGELNIEEGQCAAYAKIKINIYTYVHTVYRLQLLLCCILSYQYLFVCFMSFYAILLIDLAAMTTYWLRNARGHGTVFDLFLSPFVVFPTAVHSIEKLNSLMWRGVGICNIWWNSFGFVCEWISSSATLRCVWNIYY